MTTYFKRDAGNGSHHIYLGDELVAKVESVTRPPEHRSGLSAWMPSTQKEYHVVTHLPGHSNEHFATVHAAAQSAINHHYRGYHHEVDHPVKAIQKQIHALRKAIFDAASDHRMDNDEAQNHLYDLSMHHRALHNSFKKNFGEE